MPKTVRNTHHTGHHLVGYFYRYYRLAYVRYYLYIGLMFEPKTLRIGRIDFCGATITASRTDPAHGLGVFTLWQQFRQNHVAPDESAG